MARDTTQQQDQVSQGFLREHPLRENLLHEHLRRCLDQQNTVPAGAPRVSLEAEVPEALFNGMRAFLEGRPEWDQYRVITSALAGFLFQNGCSDRCVSQHYLDALFMHPGE